ncbi:MAG: 4Fe-4S binding protein [Spirochaetaceae bacterium]|jgi:Fe-S-cluster-containing hydrogenase component 2|nr:4Fe-4S binding protein [Spirochaetaceae bacterium]
MKKLVVSDINACMVCLTCENACALAFYKNENIFEQALTSMRVGAKDGNVKIFTCVQCGKCAKTCEDGAITQNTAGVYMINKAKCKNCGKCVEACPFKVMVQAKNAPAPSKCIACGICVKACPQNVLAIKTDEAA